MRSSAVDKGLRTGVVFGIVIVTMFLIGFTVTGAGGPDDDPADDTVTVTWE